ncbi:MAG: thioesterase family protein [Polyangiales bacterium]
MTRAVWDIPLALPRHAVSPRDTARAGDVWRVFQEAAVEASTRAGWSPERYREAGTAFVVRGMTVRHHRETTYGRTLRARTWVWNFKRDMLSTREVRLEDERGPVASATQEWVHVDASLRLVRASEELKAAFPPYEEGGESVQLPEHEPREGALRTMRLRAWYTWMDPLAHANHPAYVDWCDEQTSRVMAQAGLDPFALQPVADRAGFRAGVTAPEQVTVETRRRGVTAEGDVVLGHRIVREDGALAAQLTTVRRLATGDTAALAAAFD